MFDKSQQQIARSTEQHFAARLIPKTRLVLARLGLQVANQRSV